MATKIDQKAYLQKYLGGPSGDKKKKKKKISKGKGFKIIDDDVDISKMRPLDGDELDIHGEGEDAPQIAGIIDERPEDVKKLEQFKTSSKWRVVTQDDGFNSKLQVEEIKKDIKEVQKENEFIFGKMYSDSEDEKKSDSDISPPRRHTKENDMSKLKKGENNTKKEIDKSKHKKAENNSDFDIDPPRKSKKDASPRRNRSRNKSCDSDVSPPRKQERSKINERIRKPSRWGDVEKVETISRARTPDSDVSPPRKKDRNRKEARDFRHNYSPPLISKISKDNNTNKRKESPKRKHSVSSDMSPPRKSQKTKSPVRKSRKDLSPKRKISSDSDISPARDKHHSKKQKGDKYSNRVEMHNKSEDKHRNRHYKSIKYKSDSDESPPRKNKRQKSPSPKKIRKSPERHKRKHDSDTYLSPPRNERGRYVDKETGYKRSSDSPPPSNKKMAKTLEGKKAGLQNAIQLKEENKSFRRKEDEAFSKLSDEVSGRNAQAVSRKAKRETSEERRKQKKKAEKQKELDEKYKKWSKGVKQVEEQEARVQEFLHEAAKPLARHRDDKDLERSLKQVERAGDPMLQYIKEKKRERGELGPEKPTYKGNFDPNRFNIRPGYRWDGVDRSNGYEKKYFEHQSKRKAQEEEAYKWSTEDL